jgi:hypothetical protein
VVSEITVLISSRNRPLYLWACLDALYRGTQARHRFILVDMASSDPLVAQVLKGFERRGMFDQVIHMPWNDSALLVDYISRSLPEWSPFFAYVESDVVVDVAQPCWLTHMTALMQEHSSLAMLGSAIDRRDFVQPADVERLRRDESEARWRGLIKADSPERFQDIAHANGAKLFRPHNPAGRLLLLRTEALAKVGLASDGELHRRFREHGYDTAIATEVLHRHLSLIQVFDYPDYELEIRDRYMDFAQKSPS